MIDFGKKPDGAFFVADEGMATNILASRLAQLVQVGLLAKKPYVTHMRKAWRKRVGFPAELAGSGQRERAATDLPLWAPASSCSGQIGLKSSRLVRYSSPTTNGMEPIKLTFCMMEIGEVV